ncbi:hypothetical protein [Microbulbifer celer]|uniref:Uncharacterized protein n=1 Tax=Microbulbifer celer TaxID=435905 RepID=A0ABW3UEC2_9GAMM|nr:hypothetical protein [Microbulbifer celer]UFN58214.1 hypothetical protein LPW13_03990 [Microbulbifer celer]
MKLLWFLGIPYYIFVALIIGQIATGAVWYLLLLVPLLLAYDKLSQVAYSSAVVQRGISKVHFSAFLVLAQLVLISVVAGLVYSLVGINA